MSSASVSGKNWILKKFNEEDVLYLKNNYYLSETVSRLLAIRKIKKQEIQTYLKPSIKNILPNPFVLKDMESATKRTVEAIFKKEKIGIFGDYDVDGATSTALLGQYFKKIGHEFEIYIPDRKNEGYGPSKEGFKKLIDKNVKLIFTVDCGTLSFEPIDFAKKQKVDVLILDHHQSEINLPKAHSIINPNRLDDKSNLNYLCAAGVSFMFLISLNKALREKNWFLSNQINEPNLINYLDLVSLGTVCDVVPLVGLNRAIVKQGLKIIKNRSNLGLKTLLEMCKVENNPSTYDLGYVIGPRINAGGRVGKCSHGANLLLNSDVKESFKLASELNNYNQERKILEKDLLNKVNEKVSKNSSDSVLVLSGNNWHEGIIGIIASRIKEKYNKPTIVISLMNKKGKASARSITGFDIGSTIITAVQNGILEKGGGHKMAGGFTIDEKKIDIFKEYIIRKFKTLNIDINLQKNIYIDSVISPSALNFEFYEEINNLSPFGSGNPEPKFTIENLKPINSKIVGDKHVKSVLLGADGSTIKTIAFNAKENDIGAYLFKKNNKPFNIAGKVSLNEWRGQKNVEFIIDDISVNKNIKN
jgi:single-stranded-DNA-specific exonuclease